jgi:hypothetical protein
MIYLFIFKLRSKMIKKFSFKNHTKSKHVKLTHSGFGMTCNLRLPPAWAKSLEDQIHEKFNRAYL